MWREALVERIRLEAQPAEKFSHQARLYLITQAIGKRLAYDDDVVFAATWLHDMGVFTGHRPEAPQELAAWNATIYSMRWAGDYLRQAAFPQEKVDAAVECIRTHEAHAEPLTLEGIILRDADILEQLGAVAVMRSVCKIGRDTRFHTFADAAVVLRRGLETLPTKLKLERSRELAQPRVEALRNFLASLEEESDGLLA